MFTQTVLIGHVQQTHLIIEGIVRLIAHHSPCPCSCIVVDESPHFIVIKSLTYLYYFPTTIEIIKARLKSDLIALSSEPIVCK